MTNSIAIVGVGCRFPEADDAHQFWLNILEGRQSFSDVPADRWDHQAFFSKSQRDVDKTWAPRGAFISDIRSFAALHYGIAPRRLEVMDPQYRLLIEATRIAIQDAGLEVRGFDRARTGVFAGISVSEYKNLMLARLTAMGMAAGSYGPPPASQELRDLILETTRNVVPTRAFSIAGALTNMGAASVSQTFDLGGPSYSIDAACASASVAIHDAVAHLRAGLIDVALAGGVYLNLTPENLVGFTRVGAISASGVCRPFDARADGFVQGDGVGILLLKRLDDALRDGDRIQAVIRGVGCNNDGRGEGPMTPRVEGQLAALSAAYHDAGFTAASVSYFEAHGTATNVGDPVEVEALGRTLVEAGVTVPPMVGSVKGNVGHTMSAAGIAGVIKAIKILEARVAPPQAGFESPNPQLGLERWPIEVPKAPAPLDGRREGPLRVAVSSFGFGGTNAHIVLEEAPERPRKRASAQAAVEDPEAVVVSAPTVELLAGHLGELAAALEGPRASKARLADVAYTLNASRKLERHRVVVAAKSVAELAAAMKKAAAALPKGAIDAGETPSAPPKVCLLFPGQGAQKTGLLAAARRRFPAFARRFAELEAAVADVLPRALSSYLYPDAAVPAQEAEAALTATEVCQPAMAALSLSLLHLLEAAGVRASVSLGHSLGEFAALASAGAMSPEAAVRLVALRGRAMRALPLEDTGAMAAAIAAREAVEQAIAGIEGVAVANVNQPRQVSISGTTPAVAQAVEKLKAASIATKPLQVSHAFHSPLLAGIDPEMRKIVGALELREPAHLVVSCVSATPYGADLEAARRTMVAHATAPVDFVRGLQQAREAGATVFVHAGAGSILTGFVKATLGANEVSRVDLSPAEDDGGLELVRGLCTLAALGVPVDFAAIAEDGRVIDLPATPLVREEYWAIKTEAQPLPKINHPLPAGGDVVKMPETAAAPAAPAAATGPSPELLALFKRQIEIIEAQNRILMGGAAPAAVLDASPAAAPAVEAPKPVEARQPEAQKPVEAPKPAAAPAPKVDEAAREKVFEIVAKVSAFPRGSIRAEQKLVDELGFDSLMVADLGTAISSAFPALGGLPQSLFSLKTTVGDVADHVTRKAAAPAQAAQPAKQPLSSYRVALAQRPAPEVPEHDPAGEAWLIVDDGSALSAAIAVELEGRGARVLRVGLTQGGFVSSRLSFGALNLWHEAWIDGLPEAIQKEQIALAGVIHLASGATPLRALHPIAKGLGAPRFFVVTQMGGGLGLEAPAVNLEHAAALGYTKALARERAGEIVRALDVDPHGPSAAQASWILREALGGDLEPEVGLLAGRRVVPELVEEPRAQQKVREIGPDDVIVITGGAGEIGAALAKDLARSKPKAIAVLGRSATGPGDYFRADVTDLPSVEAAVREITARFGAPTIAIHAAGVIEDGPVQKKTAEGIEKMLAVKAGGARNLLAAIPGLRDLILVGSWAGRFGNAKQTDYSAANDLLDRVAVAATGNTRVLAVDWPPWSSTRMVASIPKAVREALAAGGVTFVEDAEGVEISRALIESGASGIRVVGRALPAHVQRTRFSVTLSVAKHAYLDDHRLKGKPVLPLAAAVDYLVLASGAKALEHLELLRGIEVEEPVTIEVGSDGNTAEIATPQGRAYRAAVGAPATSTALALAGTPIAPPMSVAEYYARHTFHGPTLQAIRNIEVMTDRGITGTVAPSRFAELVKGARRGDWSLDPVVLDASFQLAGYWVLAKHQRSGYPIGFERLTIVAPFRSKTVRCTAVLEDGANDSFRGTIRYEDAETGATLALIEGLEGRFAEAGAFLRADQATQKQPAQTQAQTPNGNGNGNGNTSVPRESWDIASFPEVEALDQRLQMAELIGLKNPYFKLHAGTARNRSIVEGVEMLNYSSYNYLGFSGHPEVVEAAKQSIERYGTSVSASRVASGERPVHQELEKGIAEHVGVEDSLVFVSGHATNVTTVGHLFEEGDLILHDALIHDSILQGIYLSGAARRPFPHGNLDALEKALAQLRGHYRRVLLVAEGIYSMDGDICDLPRLIELKKEHRALLMIDEAHSIGVLGPAGRGVGHHFPGVDPRDVDIWMGTLSKSFASCGGYIAGSAALIRLLKYTAPGFVYSAGITPPNAAAALKSLELMHRQPEVVERLRQRSRYFLEYARSKGVDTGLAAGAAVIPAIIGNSLDCLKLSAALAARRINVQPIVYPAVEDDAARLRFFLSATHTEEEIRHTVDVMVEELAKIRAGAGTSEAAAAGQP